MSSGNSDILEAIQAISSVAVRARRAAEARLRARDLTYAQYGALVALAEKDGLSQAELAQVLETDSTTAMVLRGSLEKKRLVDRKADPEDARIRRIVLTAEGRKLATQARPDIASLFGSGAAVVSEADAKKLLGILAKLKDFTQSLIPSQDSASGEKRKPGRPRKAEAPSKAAKSGKTAKTAPKAVQKAAKKVVAKPATAKKAAPKAKAAKPAAKSAVKARKSPQP
ncbi:MAG TPA: MarR family transcriptional regulator [Rectinemataceae bacterium]|nr:MarR family transcriptional regulator [Rectinemataceae bacterium]